MNAETEHKILRTRLIGAMAEIERLSVRCQQLEAQLAIVQPPSEREQADAAVVSIARRG